MNKRECTPHNSKVSNKNKLKVLLGITFSGILVIALALIVGIVMYSKKFYKREESVATKRIGVNKESKSLLNQGQKYNNIKYNIFHRV